jgi:DUF2959 family protein
MRVIKALIAVLVLLMALGTPASAASPTSRADKTAKKLLKMDEALKQGEAQLDSIMKSLNSLSSAQGADLVSKYESYSKQVDKISTTAEEVKKKSSQAKSQREDYLEAWRKDQSKIQNEQLKASSEARRKELEPIIQQIGDSLASASANFTPLLQNLNDLKLFLGNNLSAPGVSSAQDLITKCNESTSLVKGDVDKASVAIQQLAASVTPGGASK